jgi:hypothetical protein
MRNADNDNEELPFQSLAAITARLLEGSRAKNDEGPADRTDQRDDKEREKRQRQHVEQRLRDFAAFERRARGDQKER